MRKVPVVRTILFAYSFVFARILDVIRVSWIAVVLSIAASTALQAYFASQEANLEAGDLATVTNYLTLMIAVMLFILFLNGIAAVGITRDALGLDLDRSLFYFPLGRTEWRMFGANIRYMTGVFALFFLAGAVTLLAFSLAGIDLQQMLAQQQAGQGFLVRVRAGTFVLTMIVRSGPAGTLALLLAMAMLLYAAVSALRMGFFLPATITAEKTGGVRRSHELTKGNFWQVVAVFVGACFPLIALVWIRNEFAQGTTGSFAALTNVLSNAAMTVLFWGLRCAAAAHAYGALVDSGDARREC